MSLLEASADAGEIYEPIMNLGIGMLKDKNKVVMSGPLSTVKKNVWFCP